jgi:hypothetical protein
VGGPSGFDPYLFDNLSNLDMATSAQHFTSVESSTFLRPFPTPHFMWYRLTRVSNGGHIGHSVSTTTPMLTHATSTELRSSTRATL